MTITKTHGSFDLGNIIGVLPTCEWVLHGGCRYLDRLIQNYRHRVGVLREALGKSSIRVTTIPDGGYFMWCRLPPGMNASSLLPFAKKVC